MSQNISPELIASGTLLAAAIIYLVRLSFSLWGRGKVALSLIVGLPASLYGLGLLAAGLGFGSF
jgi:hypothetical protein